MKTANRPKKTAVTNPIRNTRSTAPYGVEFFHIYTDEVINGRHQMGLEYLRAAEKVWNFNYERIVLIDNYNPIEHVTTSDDVLGYLKKQGMSPTYWAYEGDLIKNAQILLEGVTDRKLRNSYLRYVDQHKKYPCSLLTASWYLTRLGYLDATEIIRPVTSEREYYISAHRLLNLLPKDYRDIEDRAHKLILKSKFSDAADRIQNLFYPVDAGRVVDLF